ncbi:integrase [Cystobacter fuscus]|uniref:Integrase n=1 Tax=Cystobacter fuscus TaxID=43 RepID=A0A250J5U5_9BACT|nr:integrase [Cystobacter fuscus]
MHVGWAWRATRCGATCVRAVRLTSRCGPRHGGSRGAEQQRAVELWNGAAEGNAVVVKTLLAQEGVEASVRTVQRAVEQRRRQVHAAQVATVRFETKPGQQMQVDFGEKKVRLGGQLVKVFLLVAVLSFSRRLFVRTFLNQRGDDRRVGRTAREPRARTSSSIRLRLPSLRKNQPHRNPLGFIRKATVDRDLR